MTFWTFYHNLCDGPVRADDDCSSWWDCIDSSTCSVSDGPFNVTIASLMQVLCLENPGRFMAGKLKIISSKVVIEFCRLWML